MSAATHEANPMNPRAVRRVVTGHDSTGKAVVAADGPSEDVQIIESARVVIADMWQLSSVPTHIDAWEKRDPARPWRSVRWPVASISACFSSTHCQTTW